MKRLHIVGRKSHGKTTVVSDIIRELSRRGLTVGAIKFSPHPHTMENPGSHSHQHRSSGGNPTALISADSISTYLARSDEDPYKSMATLFSRCNIVIVEGDIDTDAPKIEVWNGLDGSTSVAEEKSGFVAVITDDKIATDLPVFSRSETAAAADFIISLFPGSINRPGSESNEG